MHRGIRVAVVALATLLSLTNTGVSYAAEITYGAPTTVAGRPDSQLSQTPLSVAEYGGNVFILSQPAVGGGDLVRVYTRDDAYIRSMVPQGTGQGQVGYPVKMTMNPSNGAISVLGYDFLNSTMQISEYANTGTFVRSYTVGMVQGDIQADGIGNIYISDSMGGTIQQYNNGVLVRTIGDTAPDIQSAHSITIDNQNNLLVAEGYTDPGTGDKSTRILKFSPTGTLLDTYTNSLFNLVSNIGTMPALQIDVGADGTLHTLGCSGADPAQNCYISYTFGPAPGQVTVARQALPLSGGHISLPAISYSSTLRVGDSGDIYIHRQDYLYTRRFDSNVVYKTTIGDPAANIAQTLFVTNQCKTVNAVSFLGSTGWLMQYDLSGRLISNEGRPVVTIQPTIKGEDDKVYQVNVDTSSGQQVFSINELNQDMSLKRKVATIPAFTRAFAVDKNGNTYTVVQNKIYKTDSSGNQLAQYAPTGEGALGEGAAMQVDSAGVLYVLDLTTQSGNSVTAVKKYSATGEYMGTVSSAVLTAGMTDPAKDSTISGIAVGNDNTLYVTRYLAAFNQATGERKFTSSLELYSPDGVLKKTIPLSMSVDGGIPKLASVDVCGDTIFLGDEQSGRILSIAIQRPGTPVKPAIPQQQTTAGAPATNSVGGQLAHTGLNTLLLIGVALGSITAAGLSFRWVMRRS